MEIKLGRMVGAAREVLSQREDHLSEEALEEALLVAFKADPGMAIRVSEEMISNE